MRAKTDLLILFASRVAEMRLKRGWSQEVLGELTGLHRNYIGHVERLEVCPGLVNVGKIVDAFDLSLQDFLGSSGHTVSPPRTACYATFS